MYAGADGSPQPPGSGTRGDSLPADLVAMLRCPETRQKLTLASQETLGAVNARIAAGILMKGSAEKVVEPLSNGLVRKDGKLLYPVEGGIPILLAGRSIVL